MRFLMVGVDIKDKSDSKEKITSKNKFFKKETIISNKIGKIRFLIKITALEFSFTIQHPKAQFLIFK